MEEKVEVDCTRVNIGGDGREGDGGRDGDRVTGEGGAGLRGVTLTDRTSDRGGANGLSEVASLRASSNGLKMLFSIIDFTGSTTVPNILAAESLGGCGCGGCGVLIPEGLADFVADGEGDGDADDDGACSCQYMGSSSCSNSSASNPS